MHKFIGMVGCLILVSCGGGSGSSGGSTTSAPPPTPTLTVAITTTTTAQTTNEADTVVSSSFQASYTGSSTEAIVPQVSFDTNVLALDGAITLSGNVYTAKFKSASALAAAKSYSTTVTFRLCKESACTTVYPGSTQSFVHKLDVNLSDWTTRQRNAAHDGYVRATYDPTKIVRLWEFAPTTATGFDEAAARQGSVVLTQRSSDGSSATVAVNSATGVERWRYSLGNVSDASGPSLSGNRIAVSTMNISSGSNPMVVIDADTGGFIKNHLFASQWSTFAPPTPFADAVYIAAGYYGNVVYGFDTKAGTSLWQGSGSSGNTWDGQAPAADSRYVYYYSGDLDVFDRLTGARVKAIDDPFWRWNGYSYGGTPMIGSDNHVIAYSGNGMGTYSISFPLVNYDIQGGVHRWRTANGYSVIPAVANKVVYAASNQNASFDAINETTGQVVWSWKPPAGEQFAGNIVITDTLAFVSTSTAVYAIALDGTHETKWTARTPGMMMITPESRLVITPFSGQGTKVTAYSLL